MHYCTNLGKLMANYSTIAAGTACSEQDANIRYEVEHDA